MKTSKKNRSCLLQYIFVSFYGLRSLQNSIGNTVKNILMGVSPKVTSTYIVVKLLQLSAVFISLIIFNIYLVVISNR